MQNKELEQALDLMSDELKKHGISRRDAMKMAAVGSSAFLLGGTQAQAATEVKASDAKGKILIVGGGLAGMSTAARLTNTLSSPDITILEPNPTSVSYQPGQTLVGAGLWTDSDVKYDSAEYLPSGVNWIKEKATEFDPDNNIVRTSGGKELKYDFLIIAAGVKLDFSKIEGLGITDTITSRGDDSAVSNVIGKNGIASIYYGNGATQTWTEMQKFISEAKSGKKVQGVFTHPNTPIKCGGAPKKIMYLTDARLREAGDAARANAELTFYPNGGKMFGVPEYHDAIKAQFEARDMRWHYKHNLIKVDPVAKVATFNKHWKEKGAYDEDLEEYTMVAKNEAVDVPFDFLHITPPMIAAEEIGNSPVGSKKGWVPVNKETLQHVKYNNIFSLGDIAAVPMGKTGGSARKQYKVVVDNLIAAMEGKELTSKYDGYTVCPLITSIGTVMLAEFNWTKKPTPSFPLDPTVERWIWWLLKVYALKPMTQIGMLSGRA
ncbi:MAG: NAD(P)/FAD-dependent oxidoreductase [Epsilonproteobacteria bacterium]|nr:NAD(P)/FAD-dependent oxidoreductase [Campylobacterota bacterium]